MPNDEPTDELHVGLRFSISIRIADKPTKFDSFDATLDEAEGVADSPAVVYLFRTRYLYQLNGSRIDMRMRLRVPCDNVASMAPQRFPKDK